MEKKSRNSEDRHLKHGDYWERQPGETPKAWQAFQVYRDMQPKRTLVKTADQLGVTLSNIQKWSQKYRWVERCAKFDDAIREQESASRNALIHGMLERHANFAVALQSLFAKKIEKLTPDDITIGQLLYGLDVVCRLERLARGLPDQVEGNGVRVEFIVHAPTEPKPDDPDKPRLAGVNDDPETVQ